MNGEIGNRSNTTSEHTRKRKSRTKFVLIVQGRSRPESHLSIAARRCAR